MTLTGVLAPAVPLQAQPVMWPLALPQLMTAAPPVLACHMPAISGFRRGEKTTPDRKRCLSRSCDGMSLDATSCSLSDVQTTTEEEEEVDSPPAPPGCSGNPCFP